MRREYCVSFDLPDLSEVMNPHGCGFWNDKNAHEYKVYRQLDTLRLGQLDQECEIKNVGGL